MGSLIRSTGIVALSTIASRILGFLRDMLMAGYFGATVLTDAFFVAFRIPNLLRRFVAEGTLTVAFIPVYTDVLMKKGEEEALALAQKIFTLQMILILILTVLGVIFSPEIVSLMGYGFTDPAVVALTVDMNRIMFPYLFFIGLVAFSMGILNSHGYFFAPAFSPVLLNVGIITGIILGGVLFKQPIYGVAAGVIFGGFLQFLLQVPYLFRAGFRIKLTIDLRHPHVRRIVKLFVTAVYANGIVQINLLISTMLATFLPDGSLSYIYYSDRLTELVLGIFIISISNVILPEMSRITSNADMGKLRDLYAASMRGALFLAVPAAAALMAIGFPIISVLFARNRFTMLDASMTYQALFYASMGIASIAVMRITTPVFFSLEDVRKPVISATVGLVIFTVSGYLLMNTDLRHAGLTLANSISVTVQMILLVAWLNGKIGGIPWRKIIAPLMKIVVSTLGMVLVIRVLSGLVAWKEGGLAVRVIFLAAIILCGGSVYLGLCRAMKVDEVAFLIRKVRERLSRGRKK